MLCSATLDGISVGDTGRILLRSAHIFDGRPERLSKAAFLEEK